MKKGIIATMGLVLAVLLLTVGIMGCSNTSPVATTPPASPAIQAATPGVNVSLNTQVEGIWVSGTGKVTVIPDIAMLQLGIEAQEATVAEAQAKASEAMDKVMTSLTDNGVAEKDIQTQSLRISQRTRWDDAKQQEVVTGYRVTNQVVAKIRDMEKVSGIIDAVVAAGGDYTRISSLNFSVDDTTLPAYYDEAREKAIADAERKAGQIAGLAGMTLGQPTYISESATTPVRSYSALSYEMQVPAAIPAPTIVIPETSVSPGEIEISVSMQVAYEVKKTS